MHNIKIEFKNKGNNYSYKEGISSKTVENEESTWIMGGFLRKFAYELVFEEQTAITDHSLKV